jgi:translation initiation factor 2B subunit (eIF-2B alpha/beta/delta family)
MDSVDSLVERARAIASDRDSGASEIVRALLPVLEQASADGADAVRAVVRVACAAQPSMASLWNACAAAAADIESPGRLARFGQELMRQQRSIVRVAGEAIADLIAAPHKGVPSTILRESAFAKTPRIVTWSYSGTVAAVLTDVARLRVASASQALGGLTVVCAEGRPRFEGRRMAAALAGSGARIVLTTDAAATAAVEHAHAVVVGADAVLADRWINKVGTRALATMAASTGCPLVVVATREKAVPPSLEGRVVESPQLPQETAEVWSDPPTGIEIASRVFESTPADLATWFATDAGLLTSSDLPNLVGRYESDGRALLRILEPK